MSSIGWSREKRHQELVAKLAAYKQMRGVDQPVFRDGDNAGERKPLTSCTLRVATDGSGRVVNPYPVRPDSDPVELADAIFAECYGHGENYKLAGIAPTYVLQFHWAGERESEGEFPIEVVPKRQNELGASTAMVDLRQRNNQEAVVVTHLLQHGTRKDELFVSGMSGLANGYRDLLVAQRDFTQQVMDDRARLAAENSGLRDRERQVANDAIDNEIKRDNHRVTVGIKKAATELALPLVSLVGGQAYRAIGAKMGVEEESTDESLMKIAEKLFVNPKIRKVVLDEMSEEDQAKIAILMQEVSRRKDREKIKRNWSAAGRGVFRPMPASVLRDVTNKEVAAEGGPAVAGVPGDVKAV